MDASDVNEAVDYLILDAGALIRGHGRSLFHKAKRVLTVPEVLAEIRDSKARELLLNLPFEIEERLPSQDSINLVVQFAKKSGDFAALSKTDLRLIALTYMLDVEQNGPFLGAVPKPDGVGDSNVSDNAEDNVKVTPPLPPPPSAAQMSAFSWASIARAAGTGTPADVDQSNPGFETPDNDPQDEEEDTDSDDGDDGDDDDDDDEESEDDEDEEDEEEVLDQQVEVQSGHSDQEGTVNEECSVQKLQGAVSIKEQEVDGVQRTGIININNGHVLSSRNDASDDTNITGTSAGTTTGGAAGVLRTTISPYTNNAESLRMQDEDDGVGWINASNVLQHKGRYDSVIRKANTTTTVSGDSNAEDIDSGDLYVQSNKSKNKNLKRREKRKQQRAERAANKVEMRPYNVACLTTDFSMQNVLLQMTLNVMSVDGLAIKTARQWVLRCLGCYTIHYDMDRLFCRRCGGNTLTRVAASVDKGGELRLHLRKNYKVDTRGTKYSLPAPGKQGRYEGELLLREDQLMQGIWKQKCVKIRKDIKSAFGEDVTSDVGMHVNKGQTIRIGLGKQNPNAKKGRERRGKKKN